MTSLANDINSSDNFYNNYDDEKKNRHRGSINETTNDTQLSNLQSLVFETKISSDSNNNITKNNQRRPSKDISTKTKYIKRRRNTDGFLGVKRADWLAFQNSSNANIIQMMASDLPLNMQSEMQKKSTNLQTARELRHLMAKLEEEERKCQIVVEIVGNLEKENQELEQRNDNLEVNIGELRAEIHIGHLKVQSATENYNLEKQEWEERTEYLNITIKDLEETIAQQNLQMNAYKVQRDDQQRSQSPAPYINSSGEKRHTKRERRYLEQYEKEKEKVKNRDKSLKKLMMKIEENEQWKEGFAQLQDEMEQLSELTQQDMYEQSLQMKTMEHEIILLASRNSALQREKDDLISLLEDKEYESAMLKTGYEMHQKQQLQSRKPTNMELSSLVNMLNLHQQMPSGTANEAYDTYFVENESYMGMMPIQSDDISTTVTMTVGNGNGSVTPRPDNEQLGSDSLMVSNATPIPKRKTRAQPTVRDVVHEYLHLTASVVIIKHGAVGTVTSEDLVNQVKNYSFNEYHDQMVRIMKSEERKIKDEKKRQQLKELNVVQRNRKLSKSQQVKSSFGGRLKSFRKFFTGNADGRGNGANGAKRNRSNTTDNNMNGKFRKMKNRNGTLGNRNISPMIKVNSVQSADEFSDDNNYKFNVDNVIDSDDHKSGVKINTGKLVVSKKGGSFATASVAYGMDKKLVKKKKSNEKKRIKKAIINKKLFGGKSVANDLSNSSFVSVPDINTPPEFEDDDDGGK